MAVDVVLARPALFAATVLGSALLIVSLPVTIPTKSVGSVCDTLVVKPAKATFTRPVGDLDSLSK